MYGSEGGILIIYDSKFGIRGCDETSLVKHGPCIQLFSAQFIVNHTTRRRFS